MPFWVESSALSRPRTRLCSLLSPSCKEITDFQAQKTVNGHEIRILEGDIPQVCMNVQRIN